MVVETRNPAGVLWLQRATSPCLLTIPASPATVRLYSNTYLLSMMCYTVFGSLLARKGGRQMEKRAPQAANAHRRAIRGLSHSPG